ncbi:uncharacterized protein MELLADRAFT_68589 [Melampsora larici-populina 98AG31]|uniref:Uncharacterized protein n=1 Tax=Melampsora larici-populina (strain 98AG31 / pathotype 3-4-7) TaxID=747676 RepID=F4S7C7_MELLP|nr:uncharacterized protein MELLADRAFT_68589 [Melampsora larici-populina 98AG31]EGF99504.1 hypothetical protein MELLADRAFT_68589 [Melampsora larici-populina 98AG31]
MVTLAEELAQSRRLAEIALINGESGPSTRNRSRNREDANNTDQPYVDYTHEDDDDPQNDFNEPPENTSGDESARSAKSTQTNPRADPREGVERLPRRETTEEEESVQGVINAERDPNQDAMLESRNSWWRTIVNAYDNHDPLLGRTMLHAFCATYGQIPFDLEESRGRRENRDAELNHHRDRRPQTESLIQDDEFLEELVDRRDTTGTGAKSSREDKPRHRNQALSSARIRTATPSRPPLKRDFATASGENGGWKNAANSRRNNKNRNNNQQRTESHNNFARRKPWIRDNNSWTHNLSNGSYYPNRNPCSNNFHNGNGSYGGGFQQYGAPHSGYNLGYGPPMSYGTATYGNAYNPSYNQGGPSNAPEQQNQLAVVPKQGSSGQSGALTVVNRQNGSHKQS